MRILEQAYYFIKKVIFRIWALVEGALFLRLVLRFLNANPLTPVVHFIYKYTAFLVVPFENIFPNKMWLGRIVETSTLSAMLGYALLMYIFSRVLSLFKE
ncbi:MAG: hypothetical protein GF370_00145 [Candidatus Nealsonbacteria bacterium]|nr:hypothetical protein [Candidatus Nealsonbacteria bacterium]